MKQTLLRFLSLLLTLALVLSAAPARAVSEGLDTTVSIKSVEDFMAIMDDPDGSYRLDADLDLGEILPLGFDPDVSRCVRFTGSLDGNGHTLFYSLRSHPEYYSCDLGLFWYLWQAEIFNLNVNAELYMDAAGYGGLIAGTAHDTTFGGLNIRGAIRVENPTDGKLSVYAAVLSPKLGDSYTETPTAASVCQVNMDLRADLGQQDVLTYYGLLADTRTDTKTVYYSDLTGDVAVRGGSSYVTLLSDGYGCTVSQNVTAQSGRATVAGLERCEVSSLSGTFAAGLRSGSSAEITGLLNCTDCEFLGAITAGGTGGYIYGMGARGCTGCLVECPMDATVPGGTVYYDGLRESNACGFTGNISSTSDHVWATLLNLCTQSSALGNLRASSNSCGLAPVNYSDDCYGGGDVTASCTGGVAWAYGVWGNGSCYVGNISLANTTGETRVIAVSGDNSMMDGDITASSDGYSYVGIGAGNGSFYSGTVRADYIAGVDEGGYVTADLYAGKCVQNLSAQNSYFSGTIHAPELNDGISGFVDATITLTNESSFYINEGGYFTGHADITPPDYTEWPEGYRSYAVYVPAGLDVTVHHPIVGTYNAQSLGDQDVYYHTADTCYYSNHPQVLVIGDEYMSYEGTSHYEAAIQTEPVSMGDPAVIDDGWEGIFDPETEQYTPDRGHMSYTLQAVDANGNGMGGVWFHLNGEIYHADENGCLELQWGPGVISPLVITNRDQAGEDTVLRRIKSFYPIPDRVNKIQVSEALNISFLMNDPDSPSGDLGRMGGFTFDVMGHEVRLFDLPMELDLSFGTDAIHVNVTYNSDTGLYDVVLGTAASKTALPSYEDTLKALMKEAFPQSNMMKPSFKVKMLGVNWTYQALGAFSIEWDGKSTDFVVHNSKVLVEFGGEARYSTQLPPPVTFLYATAALSGSITGTGNADMSPQTIAEVATAQLFATVEPKIRLEGAIGAGSRYVDVYAEVGAGGQISGKVKFPMNDPYEDISAVGSIDVFGEIRALVFSQKVTKTLAEVQLWPVKQDAKATALGTAEEMELLPRDYVSEYALMAAGEADPYFTTPGSGEGAYPYMDLQLHMLPNGRYLLVWTDDDLTRDAADRSVLRAAIYDPYNQDSPWSECVTVDNDGTGDLFFDVCVSGDYAALIWQDLNGTFGDGTDATLEGVASAVELNLTTLDCTGDTPAVGEITTLSTGENVYESLPTVHYSNGMLRAAWITSTVNDPLYTGAEESTLWLYDGKNTAAVTTTENAIDGIAFTGSELLWSEKAAEGSALWRRSGDGTLTQERGCGVTGLQSRGNWFCWNEGGTVYRGSGSFSGAKAFVSGLEPEAAITVDSNGRVYVAERTSADSAVCELRSDGTREPIFREDGFLSAWATDGGYVAALMKTGPGEHENARLVFSGTQYPEKVAITGLSCDEPLAAPGSQVGLSLTVQNLGTTLYSIQARVTAADGTVLGEQYLSTELACGDTAELKLFLDIPETFTEQDVTVTVNGAEEALHLGGRNLAVEGQWSQACGDAVQLWLRNTGTEAAAGTLALYEGETLLWSGSAEAAAGEAVCLSVRLEQPYEESVTLRAVLQEDPGAAYDLDNEAQIHIRPILARKLLLMPQTLAVGETADLDIRVWPSGAVLPGLTFVSADPAVAAVDGSGVITAHSPGQTEITVTTDRGQVYTATVTVTGQSPAEQPFTDVEPGSFYYDAVRWAVENGITNGTSETTFSPGQECMRAQVVTFLWRAVGSPEPAGTELPFVDVPEGTYYYKPVAWAYENGITSGIDATHFGPTATCNRAQVVTFLHRTLGSPAPAGGGNPFTDVPEGSFYEIPVLWAVENGITNGLDDSHFGPNSVCNRAQIVTFLYRAFCK